MHCILALTYSRSMYATQSNLYHMWQLYFTQFPITSTAFLTDRSPLSQCFFVEDRQYMICKKVSFVLSLIDSPPCAKPKCDQTQVLCRCTTHVTAARHKIERRVSSRTCSGIDEIMEIPPDRVTSKYAYLHDLPWSVPEPVMSP